MVKFLRLQVLLVIVVLNEDDTIAGIVTKTSVARSVAENLWGDAK